MAERKAAREVAAYQHRETRKSKGTKIRSPPKQPPIPPQPVQSPPKGLATPKPSPPPSPPQTPKASGAAAASTVAREAAADSAARQRRITSFIHNLREQTIRRGSGGPSGNLIVFFDWHNTLDCALNPLKLFPNSIVDKFADLVQVAQGRIEFHIVSFCGVGRAPSTEEDANNLAAYCRRQGSPFRTVTIVNDPVGSTGKVPVLTSTGAHIHVDDREDVCREAQRANIYTVQAY